MTLQRLFATAAVGLAVLGSTRAAAAGFSGQEDRLLEAEAARAPLALSGDGAWRLHVDAHDVLHRASLVDPAREATVQLPHGVRVLSASNDGLKVALSTDRQCIGLVDFGTSQDDTAKVSWRPWVLNSDGQPLGPDTGGWAAQMPANCGDSRFAAPVAISADGRLVATADAVVDAAANRVVASLPTGDRHVLRLQFVDHDARLLIASATLGEREETAPGPSGLSVSVWDLAGKSLVDDIEIDDTPLLRAAAMQVGFSPQTGAVFVVDERRHALVQYAPGACGTAPRMRAPVGDDLGATLAVDPYGRWFASSRPLDATRDAVDWAGGARFALIVQDMATGRELARVTSRFALAGLVATPDGGTLFALAAQPVEPETGEAIAGTPAVPDAEQLVQVKLPDAATPAARDPAKAWERGFCKEAGEAPGARAMARSEHWLKPLWSRDLNADADAAAHDAQAATADLRACSDAPLSPTPFRTPDGAVWLDLGARIAALDPLKGTLAASLPTPRTKNVCSLVTPAGNGFLSAAGDTLTWRPLASAIDPARRRVVDRHPGWSVGIAGVQGDVVRVVWRAGPRTVVERDANDAPLNLLVVDVDSSGKRVREFRSAESAHEGDVGVFELDASGQRQQAPAPCHDTRGTPLAIGYDWRAGPFGTQRGVTCGPLPGMARLVWWSGATIAPRLDNSAPTPRAQPAIDGAIAAFADDTTLHVVNLALQREFAQVDLTSGTDGRTWVIAGKRLVLVESTGGDGHRWLRAYALP